MLQLVLFVGTANEPHKDLRAKYTMRGTEDEIRNFMSVLNQLCTEMAFVGTQEATIYNDLVARILGQPVRLTVGQLECSQPYVYRGEDEPPALGTPWEHDPRKASPAFYCEPNGWVQMTDRDTYYHFPKCPCCGPQRSTK